MIMENYDVIVIGAGISGLTAAALLAKKGKRVALIERQFKPGGSCGIFKRNGVIFEQGAAMLYGFGEMGFNPHRYVFNALQTPITMIRHDVLYAIYYGEEKVVFPNNIDEFVDILSRLFPDEKKGIHKFYHDMERLYRNVILSTPVFQSPDTVNPEDGLRQLKQHPLSYMRFLSYMNQSVEQLLKKYMKGKEIIKFFDKLTSTYCYATVAEAPAVLGAVMFVDNHIGGSYYPVGSTLMFTGLLEKVIEEHQGTCMYQKTVERILEENGTVNGVVTKDGEQFYAKHIIYSGNVWNLYERLLQRPMKQCYEATYASVVYYAVVEEEAIPKDAYPIEMLISNKEEIDEGEVTVYILSKDDMTLCPKGQHVLVAIGPSLGKWPKEKVYHTKEYEQQKKNEKERMRCILEKRYPNIRKHLIYEEFATPKTLERYVGKYHGAVAGPKQMLGQHMLKRQHTKTELIGLYCCGEGTVMGTGTPAVTASAIAAANVVLSELGETPYQKEDGETNYVKVIAPPYQKKEMRISENERVNDLANLARRCEYCECPSCENYCPQHISLRDIHRRLAVGNIVGAKQQITDLQFALCMECTSVLCEEHCVTKDWEHPVKIHDMIKGLKEILK